MSRYGEVTVRFKCGCIHTFTGAIGRLVKRTPCSNHDTDWETALLNSLKEGK